jgi:hypothetical protein
MNEKPLTEKVVLYFLYRRAKEQGSKAFFNIKPMLSNETNHDSSSKIWFFAPDVDMLEITSDDEIIGYEVKGQQKVKGEFKPPRLYSGLGQALFYLKLPHIGGKEQKGGAFDKVFVVHACRKPESIERDEKLGLKIYEMTPIGFICVTPQGEIVKLVEAKKNPLLSEDIKDSFLQNVGILEKFSEKEKTFWAIKEEGENFIGRTP